MTTRAVIPLILVWLTASAWPAGDIVVADFEGRDYGEWTVEGEAFGRGPAQGTLPGQMMVSGYLGHGLVNSYFHGDGPVGTLTSPPFKLQRRYLNFLIGGGKYPGETYMELLVGGQQVRVAMGPNDQPGGSERLHWQSWDVSEFAGQDGVIRIVDRRQGGWGHINVDQIVQSDQMVEEKERSVDFTLSKRYLNFPVKRGAPMQRLTVAMAEGPTRALDMEICPDHPDFWVFMDVAEFAGRKATISASLTNPDVPELKAISNEDAIRGAQDLYREKYRPQVHFSSRRGWNNDPNGLVYYAGEYHLFYQHNPYGWGWGNMHWGHAVSPDMIHWQELPVALYPDEHGTCFSGSAVVDHHNTAGFQTGAEKPMVCIYTAAGDPVTQCLAYSNDRGRTWTKYEGNPVLPHLVGSNRDPKVIWYEPDRKWIMALYLDGHDFGLFSSPDLKQWEKLCDVHVEGNSECPEFFALPLDGNANDVRWVFYGGTGAYRVGRFDGKTFTPETEPQRLHYGNCFYASQTFNDEPQGRRIVIGWGTMEMPGMPFNQMMDLPVELTLKSGPEGPRLAVRPAAEVASLRGQRHSFKEAQFDGEANPLAGLKGDLWDIEATFELQGATQVGFHVRGIPVMYHAGNRQLSCLNCTAPLEPTEGKLKLRLIVDRTSIEIFGGEGEVYMPIGVIPSDELHGLEVFARGGRAVVSLDVYALESIWAR